MQQLQGQPKRITNEGQRGAGQLEEVMSHNELSVDDTAIDCSRTESSPAIELLGKIIALAAADAKAALKAGKNDPLRSLHGASAASFFLSDQFPWMVEQIDAGAVAHESIRAGRALGKAVLAALKLKAEDVEAKPAQWHRDFENATPKKKNRISILMGTPAPAFELVARQAA